ncbi:kinase regulator Ste50 [Fusarium albosuccineum]|uniref:Kinase regulator Ste50 n=1 Tax=Fusarium albosuccineum TaxID=1237068 RepID=A0A8H4PIX1_9HYPO|nr:kinase regulator Ste50 [Fusarium albosuccineum]
MAELAASLIGIIAAGTKVAMVLSTTAADVGSAGKEAQVMAREIRSFCTILRNVTQTIEIVEDTNQMSHCSELVSEMTAVSRDMFSEILELVDCMQRSSSWGASRVNLAARVKWVINKPKLVFLRTAIEAYKTDLCLLLGSLQFAQALKASDAVGVAHQPDRSNRASQNLEELAVDYRSSLQELETARRAWDASPDEKFEDDDETAVDDAASLLPNPELESLREEVDRLHSNTSSIYSNTSMSIYSRLSAHSSRLSVLAEELSLDDTPAFQDLRRLSRRLSRASLVFPTQTLTPVQEITTPSIKPAPPKVLNEMLQWPGGMPPWGDASMVEDLIQTLSRSNATLYDDAKHFMYLEWAKRTIQDLIGENQYSRKAYLDNISAMHSEFATARQLVTPVPGTPAEHVHEIFKSLRVAMDDPMWKVLPVALKKYNISAPADDYNMYIVTGDSERLVYRDEKPLMLFKQFDKEGKKPMFMLRKKVPISQIPNLI